MSSSIQFPTPPSQPLSPISQNAPATMPGGLAPLTSKSGSVNPPPATMQGPPQYAAPIKQSASAPPTKQGPPPTTKQGPPPAAKPAGLGTKPPSAGKAPQPVRQATAPPKQTSAPAKPASAPPKQGAGPAKQNTGPSTPAMCSYCHQKPCHSGFAHCSKTCAKQSAALCDFCRKKDKYPGFDFCGKRCAARAAQTGQAVKRSTKGPLSGPLGNILSALSANVGNLGNAVNTSGLDPLQVAKLVIQQLPPAQQAPLMLAVTAAVALAKGASAAFNNSNGQGATASAAQSHGSIVPAECALGGCTQPPFVDASGDTSEYCSARHREEAVQSGQATACIMCRKYPQHGSDDFCGRACRDEAASKGLPP